MVKIMLTKKDYALAEKKAKEIINKSKTDPQPVIELLKKAGVVPHWMILPEVDKKDEQ